MIYYWCDLYTFYSDCESRYENRFLWLSNLACTSPFTQAASAAFTQLLSRLQNSIPDHALLPITSILIPWPFLQCSQLNANNELPGKAVVCYSWMLCQVSKFVRGCLRLLPVPTQQAFSFPRLWNTEVAKCTCHSGGWLGKGDGSLLQQNWDCLRVTGKDSALCSLPGESSTSLLLVYKTKLQLVLLFGMQQ